MVQLIDLLEGVPVTQDKAGARGELGHWVPSPMLPPLGTKGRCDPSSPDSAKLQARCQLHCSTHLHMLETEGRRSVATDRTRNRKHDTKTHAPTSNSPCSCRSGTRSLSNASFPECLSFCFNMSECRKVCRVSGERNPHPQCPEG